MTSTGLVRKDKMFFVGADVSKGRWLAVKLSEDPSWEIHLFGTISEIWDSYYAAKLILIDVPIGLREIGSEERLCDKEARRLLGWPRRSSVFRVPCRAALEASNYDNAKRINMDKTGKSLSKQSWGIMPKIRDVDRFHNDNVTARIRIREIHPEICLWALNCRRPMKFNKKKCEGFLERMRVLRQVHEQADEIVRSAIEKYKGRIACDDAVDALAAAVTALLGRGRLLTIPEKRRVEGEVQVIFHSILDRDSGRD